MTPSVPLFTSPPSTPLVICYTPATERQHLQYLEAFGGCHTWGRCSWHLVVVPPIYCDPQDSRLQQRTIQLQIAAALSLRNTALKLAAGGRNGKKKNEYFCSAE